jgi:hypothetical protein
VLAAAAAVTVRIERFAADPDAQTNGDFTRRAALR